MVAGPADPVVGHGQVVLHDQCLLAGVHVRGEDLPRADAEVGAHHEDAELVGHVVEHGGRIVAVVLDDADVGVGQVDELPGQPLALVHVGHGVVAPGHEAGAVEQQPVAVAPDLAEAETGHLGVHGRFRRSGLVERTLQEVEDGLAVRRAAPDRGVLPRGRGAHALSRPRRHLHGEVRQLQHGPALAAHAQPDLAGEGCLPAVAHRQGDADRALAHRGGHVHVLDPHAGLQAQQDVGLQADGGRARAPEQGVEGLLRVLADGGFPRMGIGAGAVVGVEQQVVGGARRGERGEVEAPGAAHAVVLAQGPAVEVEAAEVAHPPGVEGEAAVPDLPVGGDLETGAVPARGGRVVLELAGAVGHADPPPTGRGRIPVGSLGELPLAVEQEAEVARRDVGHPCRALSVSGEAMPVALPPNHTGYGCPAGSQPGPWIRRGLRAGTCGRVWPGSPRRRRNEQDAGRGGAAFDTRAASGAPGRWSAEGAPAAPHGPGQSETGYSVSLALPPAPSSAMIRVLSAAKVMPSA